LDCDLLSLHTSLTQKGPHATYHLCGKPWLDRGFDLVLNTARGGVVNEDDLLAAFKEQRIGNYILDAWENEPDFSDEIARHAFIATPHVAGYSKESKRRASEMVATKLCDFLGVKALDIEAVKYTDTDLDYSGLDLPFDDFLWRVHNMEHYDLELRKLIGLPSHKKKILFAKLRSETELRNEFQKIANVVDKNKLPDQINVFR
jgi:erythronate-4-phosphate dehydrogenase